jgi:hypothetical protein
MHDGPIQPTTSAIRTIGLNVRGPVCMIGPPGGKATCRRRFCLRGARRRAQHSLRVADTALRSDATGYGEILSCMMPCYELVRGGIRRGDLETLSHATEVEARAVVGPHVPLHVDQDGRGADVVP